MSPFATKFWTDKWFLGIEESLPLTADPTVTLEREQVFKSDWIQFFALLLTN